LDDSRPQDFFSETYLVARDRFCESAERLGARLHRYAVGDGDDLTIDVAIMPDSGGDGRVVVSSGVHGVEGPFGSAVQLAWLDGVRDNGIAEGVGVVLIHAVNPYGFAHDRRWNEDGVDLNRNFLDEDKEFSGAPAGYVKLDPLLNPQSAPSRWEPFRLKAAWSILRFGLPAIKEAVASGQYDYPQGLFFGGKELSVSARIFREHYASWVGDANRIVHLDLHTGLGRFGEYRLLLESDVSDDDARWFADAFDPEVVESGKASGTAYEARGTLGRWTARRMADRDFRFATADFGTHGLVRVLAALRAENRVHQYATREPKFAWTKDELRECFCPSSAKWRREVILRGVEIIRNGIDAIGR
jgi:hypothetical protein